MLFQDHRMQLLNFKNLSALNKKSFLQTQLTKLQELGTPANPQAMLQCYETLAFHASLINYGNALHNITHQAFFDILVNYNFANMKNVLQEDSFIILNDYFEWHPTAPQMRLKMPIEEIPSHIWHLFRDAQKACLAARGESDKFDLDQLNIDNLPSDQLYPLPIQMFGHYENRAVDRIYANENGEYRFVERFGVYLLPGGGMVEISIPSVKENFIAKMLEEHLEEEQGNLWQTAALYFNQVPAEQFTDKLLKITGSALFRKYGLSAAEDLEQSNAALLQDVIQKINELIMHHANDPKTKSELYNLKSNLQVELFKLTDLYTEALNHIRENSVIEVIEQFGDTRACGGKQYSSAFIMLGQPLEAWFLDRFNQQVGEFSDDIHDAKLKPMTLLQAITEFDKVKFSHLLIALAHTQRTFNNTLNPSVVWNDNDYQSALNKVMAGTQKLIHTIETSDLVIEPDEEDAQETKRARI